MRNKIDKEIKITLSSNLRCIFRSRSHAFFENKVTGDLFMTYHSHVACGCVYL